MKKPNTGRNYRIFSRNMQVKFDEFYAETVIPENDSVRLLEEIAEEVERPLERALKRTGRKYSTSPKAMLKVILYAAMENIYSSRDIEERSKRDINYIWLLNGEQAPNYRAICRFRTNVLVYHDVTCDAGYESEENYTFFENSKTECYIKPQNYERSKTKKFKSNMALRENMKYDEILDEYTCQNSKKLTAIYESKRKSKSGFESVITHYECEDCTDCPYKKNCTRAKGNRKMQVSKKFIEQRQA